MKKNKVFKYTSKFNDYYIKKLLDANELHEHSFTMFYSRHYEFKIKDFEYDVPKSLLVNRNIDNSRVLLEIDSLYKFIDYFKPLTDDINLKFQFQNKGCVREGVYIKSIENGKVSHIIKINSESHWYWQIVTLFHEFFHYILDHNLKKPLFNIYRRNKEVVVDQASLECAYIVTGLKPKDMEKYAITRWNPLEYSNNWYSRGSNTNVYEKNVMLMQIKYCVWLITKYIKYCENN